MTSVKCAHGVPANTACHLCTLTKPTPVVNHPPHYKGKSGLEAIDVIEAFELNFCLGNAVKYILRHGKKGTEADAVVDLKKAIWYIEREIQARTKEKT